MRRRFHAALVPLTAVAVLGAQPLAGQEGAAAACAGATVDATFCRTVAQGAEALLPALALAASGGSPVPGTASTLGMRLTSAPRWTVGARTTVARAGTPHLISRDGDDPLGISPVAFAIDGSVGLLTGWNPLPTVGGVASLDLLFGAAVLPLLDSDTYGGRGGWSWGAGARLGLLRESFTLPGISVSGMYRQLRSVDLGDDEMEASASHIGGDFGVFSVRAAASKAVLLLNLTAGVGYDLVYGDVTLGYRGALGSERVTAGDVRMERFNAFGSVSYTLMVLHFVLGGGWQSAPPEVRDAGQASASAYEPEGAFHVSASLRLSI